MGYHDRSATYWTLSQVWPSLPLGQPEVLLIPSVAVNFPFISAYFPTWDVHVLSTPASASTLCRWFPAQNVQRELGRGMEALGSSWQPTRYSAWATLPRFRRWQSGARVERGWAQGKRALKLYPQEKGLLPPLGTRAPSHLPALPDTWILFVFIFLPFVPGKLLWNTSVSHPLGTLGLQRERDRKEAFIFPS